LSFGVREVLRGVGLSVGRGGSVAVMGRSGCGKSSLLSCILGLVRPFSGEVLVDGEVVRCGVSGRAAKSRREKIGMVFQSGELFDDLSPVENVLVVGLLAGQRPVVARERAVGLLEDLGVPLGAGSLGELSGGERQRVAVARALMNRPALLLADEPTGALDPQTRDQMLGILFGAPQRYGCGLVVVTHDPVVAGRADRAFWLADGVLGPVPEGLVPAPASDTAAGSGNEDSVASADERPVGGVVR
jgi:lipoprotein-releasing system ATP-binding protein